MSKEGLKRLKTARQGQPMAQLKLKAKKAQRKGRWTQEDLDLAFAEADRLSEALGWR